MALYGWEGGGGSNHYIYWFDLTKRYLIDSASLFWSVPVGLRLTFRLVHGPSSNLL